MTKKSVKRKTPEATNKSRKEKDTGRQDLLVSEIVRGRMKEDELHQALEKEGQLAERDIRAEKINDKKKDLRIFISDALRKLDNDCWSFNSESEKEHIFTNLCETEDWLNRYGGDNESEYLYSQKLENLKKLVDPVESRSKLGENPVEAETPVEEDTPNEATNRLLNSISEYRMAAGSLPASERERALKVCNEVERWLVGKNKKADPILSSSEIKRMAEALDVMKDASLGVDPGPKDKKLLYLQEKHRSKSIWETGEAEILSIIHGGRKLFTAIELDGRVLECLKRAGFYGAYRLGYVKIDHMLITALVERWRAETNSFHLPIGESTITLQDIQVLTGLQVDGDAVTGRGLDKKECVSLCTRLLGESPPDKHWHHLLISLQWLHERITVLPKRASTLAVERQARAVILIMLGGYLVPHKTVTHVPVYLLQLLEDLDASGKLAWGAGVLAHLYRELCQATRKGAKLIAGCLHVIQLWAWERFSCFRPLTIGAQLYGELHPGEDPHGRRWSCHFPGSQNKRLQKLCTCIDRRKKILRLYRRQLDLLREDQMSWMPYPEETLKTLPTFCTKGSDVWLAKVPLLFFKIVELHVPDRVLRQFGRRQEIPIDCDSRKELYKRKGRKGKGDEYIDWRVIHTDEIARWNDRRSTVVRSRLSSHQLETMDPYLIWFRGRTRLRIQRPVDVEPELDVEPEPPTINVESGPRIHVQPTPPTVDVEPEPTVDVEPGPTIDVEPDTGGTTDAMGQRLEMLYQIAVRRLDKEPADEDWKVVRDFCRDAGMVGIDGLSDTVAGSTHHHQSEMDRSVMRDTPVPILDTPVFTQVAPTPEVFTQAAASEAPQANVRKGGRKRRFEHIDMPPLLGKRVRKDRTCGTHSKLGR